MDKIYIVEAYFDDDESSSSFLIGIFTDKKIAESVKDKWNSFFINYKNIFDKPDNFIGSEDEDWGYSDEWKDSKEYYVLLAKYSDISQFSSIDIREFKLNKDCLIEDMKSTIKGKLVSDDMLSLLKQWDRDYKLEDIL